MSAGALIGVIGVIVACAVLVSLLILWRFRSRKSMEDSAAELPTQSSRLFSNVNALAEHEFLTESNPMATTLWDDGFAE
jgi:hypothetical protein